VAQHEGAAITYVKFNSFMFRDKAAATDAEADAWAKDHAKEIADSYEKDAKTRWTQTAAVKVRKISFLLPAAAGPDQDKATKEKAEAALAEVKGGKEFAQVAKEKSEDTTTKDKGGDLGFVAKNGSPYGRFVEEEAQKLKVGELSPVFRDKSGYHILKAEELRAEHVQPLDEVKKQIALDLLKNERSKELARKKAEETLAEVRSGKDLKEMFPPSKAEPGKFDFSSFLTPQSNETETFHPMGGYVPGLGLSPKVSAAAFGLGKAGDVVAAPVEDNDTWFVFKLKSRERADTSKFDDAAKKQAREQLEQQKQAELFNGWLESQRKGARIEENERALSYESGAQSESYNPDDY
jgi:parvulin-like peptidyl-prolyl isomerase